MRSLADDKTRLEGVRVLVADDVDEREMLSLVLGYRGAQATLAGSAEEALATFDSAARTAGGTFYAATYA